jgi:hemoglobin
MRTWKSMLTFALIGAVAASIGCGDDTTAPAATRGEVATEPAAETPAADAEPAVEPAATDPAADAGPKDGELALPASYKDWTVFLSNVQRPDAKQVRDIYVNDVAEGVEAGQPLPFGSVLVMELYNAKLDDAGAPVVAANGELERDALATIFVMGKGPGWTGEPQNGEWVYAAYEPDGQPATIDYVTCRACHLPQEGDDYVFRLGEYIAARGTGTPAGE